MLVLIVLLGMHNFEGISYSERILGLLSMLSAKRSVSCRVRKLLSGKLMYCLVTMAGEATREPCSDQGPRSKSLGGLSNLPNCQGKDNATVSVM
jgi:hypothetical protein